MSIKVLPLSDTKIAKAKPQEKEYALFDGDGLYLLVKPSGSKLWRFKYPYQGKDRLISFGKYPEVTLSRAREKRLQARQDLDRGIDPKESRHTLPATDHHGVIFESLAREWHDKNRSLWSADHAKNKLQRLEKEVFPFIGQLPAAEITPKELLAVLRRIEARGAIDTAHRVRFDCGAAFRYGVATGACERDISADLRGALPPVISGNYAAPVEPETLRPMLLAIEGYHGGLVVRSALKLAPMLFTRPGELRHMMWEELDLDDGLWKIPAGKMKMKIAHLVPLSRQAVDTLRELQPLTGRSPYVFPGGRSYLRPMSENAVNAALRVLGLSKEAITGHGFRATARTILEEVLDFRADIIEHQLAHKVKDPNGRAYNRTKFLDYRRKMMQVWSDYLDTLKTTPAPQ